MKDKVLGRCYQLRNFMETNEFRIFIFVATLVSIYGFFASSTSTLYETALVSSLIFYHFRRGTLFFYHGKNNSDHISDRIKYIFSALLFKKASRLFPAYACKNCAEIGSHSLCRKNIGAGISNDQRSAYP